MTGEFKIEKNIKRPQQYMGRGRKLKYPFHDMKVGDSFFIPVADQNNIQKVGSIVRNAANMARMRNKTIGRFSTRAVDGGVRVWRIE